jgi:hypothetical protein
MIPLKPLSVDAIPAALAKAERYRLLNEPDQAESICLDILIAEPGRREAVVTLLLALTDRFGRDDGAPVSRALALAASLDEPYERAYYHGLVAERRGRALFDGRSPGRARSAGIWIREAMEHYEAAEAVRPAGNDDARLRWNACARMLNTHATLREIDTEPATPLMLE